MKEKVFIAFGEKGCRDTIIGFVRGGAVETEIEQDFLDACDIVSELGVDPHGNEGRILVWVGTAEPEEDGSIIYKGSLRALTNTEWLMLIEHSQNF